jgi:hypothetical protein
MYKAIGVPGFDSQVLHASLQLLFLQQPCSGIYECKRKYVLEGLALGWIPDILSTMKAQHPIPEFIIPVTLWNKPMLSSILPYIIVGKTSTTV